MGIAISDLQWPPVIGNILALARSTLMKQMTVDRSLILTMKIGRAESPLTSFLFVLSYYGETLGGHGFVTVSQDHMTPLSGDSPVILS